MMGSKKKPSPRAKKNRLAAVRDDAEALD